jgi:SAM-dependent methyltransferase
MVRRLRARRNYYSVYPAGATGRILSRFFPNKKLTCLSQVPLSLDARILDVGCGAGWRLYALREAGFLRTAGIDPFLNRDEIVHDNGLRIQRKNIHGMDGTWDLIMFNHSFEHVPDPIENLQKAAVLLERGGTCLLRLPIVDSYAWERYRENWYQIDAPRHYYLHSRTSIGILAESAGLSVQKVVHDSTADQFWKSERNERAGQQSAVVGRWKKIRWKLAARRLNREGRGDQAVFYLRKV